MNRRRRPITWRDYDGTAEWAVNAAGQIVELREDAGRWLVTAWTPFMPSIGPMALNCGSASTGAVAFTEFMLMVPDELGPTPAQQIARHRAMRQHPSWGDGEERP